MAMTPQASIIGTGSAAAVAEPLPITLIQISSQAYRRRARSVASLPLAFFLPFQGTSLQRKDSKLSSLYRVMRVSNVPRGRARADCGIRRESGEGELNSVWRNRQATTERLIRIHQILSATPSDSELFATPSD